MFRAHNTIDMPNRSSETIITAWKIYRALTFLLSELFLGCLTLRRGFKETEYD